MHEDKEREWILSATETLKQHAGVSPKGWLGPWISESHVTPDLLQVHLPFCNSNQFTFCVCTTHQRSQQTMPMKFLRMLNLNETSHSMLSNVARLFDRMMNQTHSPGLQSGCVRALQVPFAKQLDNLANKSTAVNGKRGHY